MTDTWQLIETAPKDGTRILTAYKGTGLQINFWRDPSFQDAKNGWYCSPIDVQPTHWLPLPEPPL